MAFPGRQETEMMRWEPYSPDEACRKSSKSAKVNVIPAALMAGFAASHERLLDVTRRAVDDSMLREIAQADYGVDADAYLAALRPIRDTGILPLTVTCWEVLNLTIFSGPNGPDREACGSADRANRMRAFACAVALQGGFEGCGAGMAETALVQCLVSARQLGEEMNTAIGSFITWAMPVVDDADRWLFALGLLIATIRDRSGRFSQRDLGEAAAWVLAEEGESRRAFSGFERPPAPFGLHQGFWRPLATELIDRAATLETKTIRDDFELLGQYVIGAV
jgi:hypothetical protein